MSYDLLADRDDLVRRCISSLSALESRGVYAPEGTFSGRILMRRGYSPDRPAVIASNGGGCYPLSAGYLGENMADASVNGNVRCAPSAYDIYEAARIMNCRRGCILIYNHFMGDYLNNDMAQELLALEGIPSIQVPCRDDCFSAPGTCRSERTGLTGILYMIRIASMCASSGMELPEIQKVLDKAAGRLATVTMTLDHGNRKVMLGAGFSGEPPHVVRDDCFSPEASAALALDTLVRDLKPQSGEKLYLMVSRLVQTMPEDGLIFASELKRQASAVGPLGTVSAGCYTYLLNDHGFFVTMLCADETLQPYMGEAFHPEGFVV